MALLFLLTGLGSLLNGGGGVLCYEFRIDSADSFIAFSTNRTRDMLFAKATVFLDSDIDFSGKTFEPIGNITYQFYGTFYGQGHVISNLEINSTLESVGLFGYSWGMTIKNVVMDSSCSFTSSHVSTTTEYSCVGSAIGWCESYYDMCVVENVVNMGNVAFSGNTAHGLHLGGIIGYASYNQYFSGTATKIKNCANYGSVTHMGASGSVYLGGISGLFIGKTPMSPIQNCLNYGLLTNHNTKSASQYSGGICGYAYFTSIENCASLGGIVSLHTTGSHGAIASEIISSNISYCYWDSGAVMSPYETIDTTSTFNSFSFNTATFELSESVSVGTYTGTSLLEALNAWTDHYYLRDYSHWALNRNENIITFKISGNTTFSLTINSQIILLPSLVSYERLWFDGWYTDASCASPLESFEITGEKDLYGKWKENANRYTITFDTKREGVSIEPITAQFGSVVSLPRENIRDNCTVRFWENDCGDVVSMYFTVPARNMTLHAVWSCTVIRSAADLVDISKIANSGLSFYESAIFLDSDIDFTDELSQQFEPIGKDYEANLFKVFDGQGHIISNLKINSASNYVGFFGLSFRTDIRNVVLDSTCSVISTCFLEPEPIRVGSIIGYCHAYYSSYTIENIVNMATVSFNGNTSNSILNLGGITGILYTDSPNGYTVTLKNCVNYGSVFHTGTSRNAYIGGIAGNSEDIALMETIPILNCLNYGSINFNGTVKSEPTIGGIIGLGYSNTKLENCVSAGRISSSVTNAFVGAVVGKAENYIDITHCLWTSDVRYDIANGGGSPTVTNSSLIASLDATTMDELDEYTEKKRGNTWSRWVMLHLNGGSINSLTQETPIGGLLKSLPLPVKEGDSFLFWCTDEGCSEQYDPPNNRCEQRD